jgi:hypothetical protein
MTKRDKEFALKLFLVNEKGKTKRRNCQKKEEDKMLDPRYIEYYR